MPSTYIHLSGDDVDDALLKMYGLKQNGDGEMLACPKCKTENSPLNSYCGKCGHPFNLDVILKNEEERTKYDELMSKLMENEKVREVIKEALRGVEGK